MMLSIISFTFLLATSFVQADKVLRVEFSTATKAKEFQRYTAEKNLDIWSLRRDSADVAVSEENEKDIKQTFNATELVPDVESAIKEETKENKKVKNILRRFRSSSDPIYYFARYNEIVSWLSKLASNNDFVSLQNIGETYEGRKMTVVRVSQKSKIKIRESAS